MENRQMCFTLEDLTGDVFRNDREWQDIHEPGISNFEYQRRICENLELIDRAVMATDICECRDILKLELSFYAREKWGFVHRILEDYAVLSAVTAVYNMGIAEGKRAERAKRGKTK